MIARAAVSGDMKDIITAGLSEIPLKSRLAEGISAVLQWHDQHITWEDALNKLHSIWNEADSHHWCHVISNAMICVISLLWGGGDFAKTVGIAICAGFDTDCNAATTGSVIGMIRGAEQLPEAWIRPLNNRLISGICGMADTPIAALASRTFNLARGAAGTS